MFETSALAKGAVGWPGSTQISLLALPLAGFFTATTSAMPSLVTSASRMPGPFCRAIGVGIAEGAAK